VDQKNGRTRELLFLPAAMSEQSYARLDLEESSLIFAMCELKKSARPVVSRERLRVAADEFRVRVERP
jgi:hypothetical protein